MESLKDQVWQAMDNALSNTSRKEVRSLDPYEHAYDMLDWSGIGSEGQLKEMTSHIIEWGVSREI